MESKYYSLTRDEATQLYGAENIVGFRWSLDGSYTFADKTATDRKAKKLNLKHILRDKYVYTEAERREIVAGPDFTDPNAEDLV